MQVTTLAHGTFPHDSQGGGADTICDDPDDPACSSHGTLAACSCEQRAGAESDPSSAATTRITRKRIPDDFNLSPQPKVPNDIVPWADCAPRLSHPLGSRQALRGGLVQRLNCLLKSSPCP